MTNTYLRGRAMTYFPIKLLDLASAHDNGVLMRCWCTLNQLYWTGSSIGLVGTIWGVIAKMMHKGVDMIITM